MADQVERQVLRLEVDQNAARRAVSETERFARAIADMRKEALAASGQFSTAEDNLAQYGQSAKAVGREIDRLRGDLSKSKSALRDNRKELDANADAARELARQTREARDEAGLFGDVESRTRAITGAVGFVGGEAGQRLEQSVNVGAEVLASVEAIKLLKLELPELVSKFDLSTQSVIAMTVAAGATAAAVLVAKGALDDLASGSQAAQIAASGLIDGLRNYYEFQSDATTRDVSERIRAINEQREQNNLLIEDLNRYKLAILQGLDVSDQGAIDTFAEGTLKLLDAAGLVGTGLDEVNDAINQTQTETQALNTEFNLLVDGFANGAFAANDAAAAAERTAIAEAELARLRSSQLLSDTRLQIRAAQLSEEQAQARLDQIAIERQYYGALANDLQLLADTNEVYAGELANVQSTLEALNREEAILGALRFDEVQSTDALSDLLVNSQAKFGDARKAFEDYTAAQEKYADTVAKRELKLAQDAETFALERTRDLADHYAELAELDRDFYAERGDILREMRVDLASIDAERADELESLNEDLQDLAREHAASMRRIERDSGRDILAAASRFDAFAVFQAEQQRRDALEDEQQQYEDEKTEREKQFQERLEDLENERIETQRAADQALRDLEEKHQQERIETQRAYAEEQRRINENNQLKLRQQQAQWDLEDQKLDLHFGNQEAAATTHYSNMSAIQIAGLNDLEARFASSFNTIANSAVIPTPIVSAVDSAIGSVLGVLNDIPLSSGGQSSIAGALPLPTRTASTAGNSSLSIGDVNVNVPAVAGGVTGDDIGAAVLDHMLMVFERVGF